MGGLQAVGEGSGCVQAATAGTDGGSMSCDGGRMEWVRIGYDGERGSGVCGLLALGVGVSKLRRQEEMGGLWATTMGAWCGCI